MFTDTVLDAIQALAFLVAAACFLAWPLSRERTSMLAVQIASALAFAVFHAMTDAQAAFVLSILSVLQALCSLRPADPVFRRANFCVRALIAITCVVTWHGLPSLFGMAAFLVISIGRVQIDVDAMRKIVSVGYVLLLIHNIMVDSYLVILGWVGLIVCACAIIYSEHNKRFAIQ